MDRFPTEDDLMFTPRTNAMLGLSNLSSTPAMPTLLVDPDLAAQAIANANPPAPTPTQNQTLPQNPTTTQGFSAPLSELQLVQAQAQLQTKDDQMRALLQSMLGCFQAMTDRILSLESSVTQIQEMLADQTTMGQEVTGMVDHSVPSPSSSSHTSNPTHNHTPTAPSTCGVVVASPPTPGDWKFDYQLQLDGVEDEYYSERPFPPFIVRLVDSNTSQVCTQASEWQVRFRLLDGYGRYVDTKLADDKTKTPYLTEGETEVSGLRFMQVSSKNGGSFMLECELIHPTAMVPKVQKVRSQNITIMSCRLFNQRKSGSFSRLSGADPVSKLPGIGRQYHMRLCEVGLRTIQDLANLSDLPEGRAERQNLLDRIRKDQGALTEPKFLAYIKTAKAIVSGAILNRGRNENGDHTPQQRESLQRGTKRPRTDISQEEVEYIPPSKHHQSLVDGPDPFGKVKSLAETFDGECCDQFLNQQLVDTFPGSFEVFPPAAYVESQNGYAIASQHHNSFFNGQQDNGITRSTSGADVTEIELEAEVCHRAKRTKRTSIYVGTDVLFPLHLAVATGRISTVKRVVNSLIEKKQHAALGAPNPQSFTPLMLACALGHDEIVRFFVGMCADSDGNVQHINPGFARQDDGWTALHMAVLNKHEACVEALLGAQNGVDACAKTNTNWTPLMMAAIQGHTGLLTLLAETADKTDHVTTGVGLVHLAVLSGETDAVNLIVDTLLQNSTNDQALKNQLLQKQDTSASNTAPSLMHCAAFCGREDMMELLLNAGVAHSRKCVGGWTPLHVCALRGQVRCLRLLIKAHKNDLNLDETTDDGWTALSIAAMGGEQVDGSAECVEELLEAGAQNTASKVQASVVSVVCSNMRALMVLAGGKPNEMQHSVTVKDKQVQFSTRQLGRSVSSKDVVLLCDALDTTAA